MANNGGYLPTHQGTRAIQRPSRLDVTPANEWANDQLEEKTTKELMQGIEGAFAADVNKQMHIHNARVTIEGITEIEALKAQTGSDRFKRLSESAMNALQQDLIESNRDLTNIASGHIAQTLNTEYRKPKPPVPQSRRRRSFMEHVLGVGDED